MKYLLIFMVYLGLLIENVNSQPGTTKEEFNRKRHWVGGTYGHPYTMFDRHNELSFKNTINKIKVRIKSENIVGNEGPVFTAYQLVYNNAMQSRPLDNGIRHGNGPSDLALWAKNNAFVMLVGLNGNGDTLSLHERQLCKDRVIDAFNNMSKDIPTNDFKNFTFYSSIILRNPIFVNSTIISQLHEESFVKKKKQFQVLFTQSHIMAASI